MDISKKQVKKLFLKEYEPVGKYLGYHLSPKFDEEEGVLHVRAIYKKPLHEIPFNTRHFYKRLLKNIIFPIGHLRSWYAMERVIPKRFTVHKKDSSEEISVPVVLEERVKNSYFGKMMLNKSP